METRRRNHCRHHNCEEHTQQALHPFHLRRSLEITIGGRPIFKPLTRIGDELNMSTQTLSTDFQAAFTRTKQASLASRRPIVPIRAESGRDQHALCLPS
jgi:hypothetical protein